tara:strand:+ start:2804 stop:3646 length:843 start_codon:yes stop_codon:yes gene_type:complete
MYYPKSQIKTDLYTSGEEFITSNDGIAYQGYYFSTSDNLYYTGRNPNDKPNYPLSIIPNSLSLLNKTNIEVSDIDSYYNYPLEYSLALSQNTPSLNTPPSLPIQTIILPTEEEYKITEYQRYFVKKVNEIIYIEISQKEYKKYTSQDIDVSYQLYTPFTLPWVISGNRNEVSNINKKTIQRISSNLILPGFNSYFKGRYDQYFKYTPGENLKTDGSEFLIEKSNKPYIGLYHIHPKKGPMVGAQHINTPHNYLIPISGSNQQYKVNKIETQSSNRISGGY